MSDTAAGGRFFPHARAFRRLAIALGIAALALIICVFARSTRIIKRLFGALASKKQFLKKHEATLAELVDFHWDHVSIVGPYELSESPESMLREIFGVEDYGDLWWLIFSSNFGNVWWASDPRYWTIVYRRPGHSPCIIWMDFEEWGLAREIVRGSHRSLKFRLVESGKGWMAGSCGSSSRRCVRLE